MSFSTDDKTNENTCDNEDDKRFVMTQTTEMVCAISWSNPNMSKDQVKELVMSIHETVSELFAETSPPTTPQLPAVPKDTSVQPDFIVCLEDGKKFKSLKRHLRTHYNLSPEEYRKKWDLPFDYPMVAPNYSKARSQLAKKMGLGQRSTPSETPPQKKQNGARRMVGSDRSAMT